jgi:O-antigen/teichoic acid export membrane protein
MLSRIRSAASRFPVLETMLISLGSRTGKDTQIVLGGEFLGAGLGFLANLILLRKMSVDDYGLLSLFLSLMMMISGLMHFGWLDTYVRFGAKYLDSPHFYFVRRHCLKKITLSIFFTSLVVAASSHYLCVHILKREGQEPLVFAALAGAISNLLFTFAQNDYRVNRAFKGIFVTRVGSSAYRILYYIALLITRGLISLTQSILIQISSLLLFTVHAFVKYQRQGRSSHKRKDQAHPVIAQEMSDYNLWIVVSFICTTLTGNIDIQILSHFHSNHLLSNYGAATRLTLPFQLIVNALTTTLVPRLSAARSLDDSRYYLRRIWQFLAPAALLQFALIFVAPPVVIWMAGDKYSGISNALKIQLAATLVMFLTNPVGLVLAGWGWSRFFALLNVAQLIVDVVLDLLWIPPYGVEGALASTLVMNFMGLVSVNIAVWWAMRDRSGA